MLRGSIAYAEDAVRLGHVISVAGSEIWGSLDPGATHAAEIGAVVRLLGSHGRSFGVITSLKRNGRRLGEDDDLLVEIRLVGEILGDDPEGGVFQRGVSNHPALDGPIFSATRDELRIMYARPDAATIRLGTLRQAPDLDAFAITDNLLGKHFAVLGTTGAGKSCAVTLIMQAILDAHPFGHIVMLDPHNEYARAFAGRAELLNPATLRLPYWLLNFEEIAEILVSRESPPDRAYSEMAILRRAILAARQTFAAGERDAAQITIDTPVPYRLSELVRIIREEMGAFNKADSSAPYQHLISRIESVASDKRFEFMFSSFLVQDNMDKVLSQILRVPVDGRPITIIDISGVPSDIVDVVVSVLFRLIFEFALWSERGKSPPVLLVCEEAHRYVPQDERTGFAPTKRSIGRIAKEGRKYGLGLCLVTQRPAELSVSSLSQCNTIFALRLGNEHDLEFVRHAVPDSSRWLMDALPALNTREAIVVGDGVPVPMHIRFDELLPNRRPASMTPGFASAWQRDVGSPRLVAETVARWRDQARVPSSADAGSGAGDETMGAASEPEPVKPSAPAGREPGAPQEPRSGLNGHFGAEPHDQLLAAHPSPAEGDADAQGERVSIRLRRETRPMDPAPPVADPPEPAVSASAQPAAHEPTQPPAPRPAGAQQAEPPPRQPPPSQPAGGAHPLRAARRLFGRQAL
jgi:DNA helicase HerA-like ATPase